MAVALTYATNLTVVETLANNTPSAPDATRKVTHTNFNSAASLSAATTPPVTTAAFFQQLLTAGAATIDLTALTGTNGATVNLTGLKVQAIKFKALATNANPITIGEGASNGYELLGSGWTLDLAPGQEIVIYGNDATPDVGGSAKEIDLAGTGTQGLEVSIVAG